MDRQNRLYNVIFPIWLLLALPQAWLIVLPANLLIDCGVLLITLRLLKQASRRAVLRKTWWKLWLLGFLSDGAGVLWMFLALIPGTGLLPLSGTARSVWENSVGHVTHNSFSHPAAFLWTLAGVAIAGAFIYLFDRHVLRDCGLLSEREARKAALTLAVVTAPWFFFIPMY